MRDAVIRAACRAAVIGACLAAIILPVPAQTNEQASEVESTVVPPRIILKSQSAPTYPPAALAGRFEGEVTVEATVNAKGEVEGVRVLECTHTSLGFEDAAIDAVRTWKFHPALREGQPIDHPMKFRLSFRATGPEGQTVISGGNVGGSSTDSSHRDVSPNQARQLDRRPDPGRGGRSGGGRLQ